MNFTRYFFYRLSLKNGVSLQSSPLPCRSMFAVVAMLTLLLLSKLWHYKLSSGDKVGRTSGKGRKKVRSQRQGTKHNREQTSLVFFLPFHWQNKDYIDSFYDWLHLIWSGLLERNIYTVLLALRFILWVGQTSPTFHIWSQWGFPW